MVAGYFAPLEKKDICHPLHASKASTFSEMLYDHVSEINSNLQTPRSGFDGVLAILVWKYFRMERTKWRRSPGVLICGIYRHDFRTVWPGYNF